MHPARRPEAGQKAKEVNATKFINGTLRTRECERLIAEPMRVCARLLEQEYKRNPVARADEIYLFRLGELVLLCTELTTNLPELNGLARELAARLDTITHSKATLAYIDFIRNRLPNA